MMSSSSRKSRYIWLAFFPPVAALIILSASFYMLNNRSDYQLREPSFVCQIELLSVAERLEANATEKARAQSLYDYPLTLSAVPDSQVNNPVLMASKFARVRILNDSAQAIEIYDLASTVDLRPEARNGFVVQVEVRDSFGSIISGRSSKLKPQQSVYELEVPTAEFLVSHMPPKYLIRPSEVINLNLSILSNVTRTDLGLKPDTYTVRALVSYAEAPSGETKRIASEPVKVTVTEENIKAAEAHWNSAK